MSTKLKFGPWILGFICNRWVYGAADLAGVSRQQYATHTKLIRVMCTGGVELAYVLSAFLKGIDVLYQLSQPPALFARWMKVLITSS